MLIIDIANGIFIDEGEPTNTSIPAIAFWIRGSVGRLNSILCESFKIDGNTLEILNEDGSEIDINAVAVLKQLFRVYFLQLQVNNNMNALASDSNSLLSVKDEFGGASFTRVNRNEISKTIISMRKDEIDLLNDLVSSYKINKSNPRSINGDDVQSALPYESFRISRNI